MTDLRQKAAEVASAGRFGDSVLIHVAPEELAGLASLMPGGKLTTNPKTGLPEAFFFLPFLAGLGGLGAGAAAAGTAAATGALGAGLGAGMTAAALPLAATTAGTTAGALGAAGAGAAGLGAASALPLAGTAAATSALPGIAGTAASTLPAAAIPTSLGGIALPEVAAGAAGSAIPAVGASSPFFLQGALPTAAGAGSAGAGGLGSIGISGGGTAGAGAAGAGTAASALPATGAGTASTLGGALPGSTGAAAAGVGAGAEAAGTLAVPQAASSGIFGGMSADKLLQYGALASMMMPQGGGDDEEEEGKEIEGDNYERGEASYPDSGSALDEEWDYFPGSNYFSGGGLVKGYAEGGLATLDKKAGGKSGSDGDLVEATMMALMGQAPNADAIIEQFVATFGREALQDLINRLQSSSQMQAGQPQGDGMSDSVPAMISGAGGQQPAALSEGEYVVPADVVSGLGNGSTSAGANQLQGMVDRTRMMRTGGVVQPPAINPGMALPR